MVPKAKPHEKKNPTSVRRFAAFGKHARTRHTSRGFFFSFHVICIIAFAALMSSDVKVLLPVLSISAHFNLPLVFLLTDITLELQLRASWFVERKRKTSRSTVIIHQPARASILLRDFNNVVEQTKTKSAASWDRRQAALVRWHNNTSEYASLCRSALYWWHPSAISLSAWT